MRKYALLKDNYDHIKKVMLHETEHGTYLFSYDTVLDKESLGDEWFLTLEEAEKFCKQEFNIQDEDWIYVQDPLNFCQQDYLRPVRIKGRQEGNPQWGYFEELIDGTWIDFIDTNIKD